nr:inner centromere protein A-like [Onthophagus taurus]
MGDYQDFLKCVTDFSISLHDDNTVNEIEEFFFRKEKELDTLLGTGYLPEQRVKVKKERITNVRKEPNAEEFKENSVNLNIIPEEKGSTRCTRSKALKDGQNELNIKVEKIKEEKISDVSTKAMPPPQQPLRKGRTKKVPTSKVKSERESDVIIQLPHISLISLTDSDDEEEKPASRTKTKVLVAKNMEEMNATKTVKDDPKKKEMIKKKKSLELPDETFSKDELKTATSNKTVNLDDIEKTPVRSTRTKTRAMAAKSMRQVQCNVTTVISEKEPSKRSRSPLAETNDNKRKKSIEVNDVVNETYIKTPQKPVSTVNETIIISKEQRMIVTTPLNKQVPVDDLLTDDEDVGIHIKTKKTTTKKPIFSQYETSPVKKRVEAFEKLGAEIAAQTQSTSRKNNIKENSIKPSYTIKSKQITPLKSGIPTYTNGPLSSSKMQTASKSALKNTLPPKTISNLKASQQEYIEREARRREKEQEALRKKEALLQAKQEEIKRKNEEKQLKLAHLKAKQEAEEMERIKEQQKQAKAEKYSHKKQPQKKMERPLYMDVTAPLLPLDDCFDSDDERQEKQERVERPGWTRTRQLLPSLMRVTYAGMDFTNTFFMRKATTPNLEDLFGPMNSNKLKRTSSAIWTKPPRFTLIPIPQHDEEDGDEI